MNVGGSFSESETAGVGSAESSRGRFLTVAAESLSRCGDAVETGSGLTGSGVSTLSTGSGSIECSLKESDEA